MRKIICFFFGHLEAQNVRYHSQLCVVDMKHGGSSFAVVCDRCGAVYIPPPSSHIHEARRFTRGKNTLRNLLREKLQQDYIPDDLVFAIEDWYESQNTFSDSLVEQEEEPHFSGTDFMKERDEKRLTGQVLRIYDYMKDGAWRTLGSISEATGDPPASISAQLRNLRKKPFGSHVFEREYVIDGLYQYRLAPQ